MDGSLTLRAVKDHFRDLLGFYNVENKRALKSSGTEEDYDEKIQLLESVSELKKIKDLSPDTKRKAIKERTSGQAMRQIRMDLLKEEEASDSDSSSPSHATKWKRTSTPDTVQLLQQSQASRFQLASEKLEALRTKSEERISLAKLQFEQLQEDRKIERERLALERERLLQQQQIAQEQHQASMNLMMAIASRLLKEDKDGAESK
jgi:hypothetical protein